LCARAASASGNSLPTTGRKVPFSRPAKSPAIRKGIDQVDRTLGGKATRALRAWSRVPSVTSQFSSYFAAKITSASVGYARSGGLAWHCCLFFRFIPKGVFDDATVRNIGRAFDLACKELNDAGQPDVVHEVMIKRIIAAARRGERDVKRLRDAGLP
jgi:hypothetical protein